MRQFEPLLADIAAVARGQAPDGAREQIEALLPRLEANGWHLSAAVARIWAGERDGDGITQGLDAGSDALVRRILELVDVSP